MSISITCFQIFTRTRQLQSVRFCCTTSTRYLVIHYFRSTHSWKLYIVSAYCSINHYL